MIDNIPPQMLESIAELVTQDGAKVPKVALGIDVDDTRGFRRLTSGY